jgi:hypothetical protein
MAKNIVRADHCLGQHIKRLGDKEEEDGKREREGGEGGQGKVEKEEASKEGRGMFQTGDSELVPVLLPT